LNTYEKAINDAVWNAAKAADDILDAGKAAVRLVDNQIKDQGKAISNAEKRVREGKVVDAVWHLGTDKAKSENTNWSTAAQESELLRTGMQTAATFYGGPAGAAAFAAWYRYNATGGNVD
jgi:hypothetical protein